ncbi:MAG TPA: hypothetical protein GX708_11985 [Gallicola sp.]|nr:hypothetical protein [Gallicola sp.]
MEKNLKHFKEGIFSLNTRRFGKIAEIMIKKLYDLHDSKDNAYDLIDNDGNKVEVKFSTVLKKSSSSIEEDNILESIFEANIENRVLSYAMIKEYLFDSNIQQIKTKEFDVLYYGCFFEDRVMICKIEANKIPNDPDIMYSNKQHRGNDGEGQFHINNKTIDYHVEEYLEDWIMYEELLKLFED